MGKQRILVVDDEAKIREIVGSYLEHAGYAVLQAETGRQGLADWERHKPDLVVLDLMLPDITGEEVCRLIRRQSTVPILMLTAKVAEESLLQGFHIGADDYLTKPFSPRELVVRVQTLLKRAMPRPSETEGTGPEHRELRSKNGRLRLDTAACKLRKDGAEILLTGTEFRLLETFLAHPNRVFSRIDLVRIALGEDFNGSDRTVDAHIKNLRHKIEDEPKNPQWIQTVHGLGYRMEQP